MAEPYVHRYGPGVPAAAPASQVRLPATEAWQAGQPQAPRERRGGGLGQTAGAVITLVLLAVSVFIIYGQLHRSPLRVTGVAITGQAKRGCAVDLTGRIDTSGGGVVSYQWVFTPELAAPRPLSQSVAAGQSAVDVIAVVQGQGHGRLAQRVTLQVLGPGKGSASAHVVISC